MMVTKTFQVPNIGCNGCVTAIKNELSEMAGVKTVEGEVESKTITVEWDDPANWDAIVERLVEIEYAPAEG